jgi:predicted transcriptional regulator of viral defense system
MLAEALMRIGRGAAYKRLGFLLETLSLDEPELIAICLRRRSKGTIALDPAVRTKGRLDKRWGLRVNVRIGGHEEDG